MPIKVANAFKNVNYFKQISKTKGYIFLEHVLKLYND